MNMEALGPRNGTGPRAPGPDAGSPLSTALPACDRHTAASLRFKGLFYYMLIIKVVGKVNKTLILDK